MQASAECLKSNKLGVQASRQMETEINSQKRTKRGPKSWDK